MARRLNSMARRLKGERGFTLTELMITAALVATGLVALTSTLDHSRDLVNLSDKIEAANHQAELEIERLLSIPYAQLAMRNPSPTPSADPKDPNYYVITGPPARYQWDHAAGGQSNDLVFDDVNGVVNPSRITWTDNEARLSGTISRFVTWTGDLCERPSCEPAEQRAKRITVAVTVDGPKAPRRPIVISTIKSDPVSTG
jgi:prepilin-type N-terminal cleavage/methylation domain-containing protein